MDKRKQKILNGETKMSDNERVKILQDALMGAVNASNLPLSVKAIILENLLLRTHNAILQYPDNAENDQN